MVIDALSTAKSATASTMIALGLGVEAAAITNIG